LCSQPYITVFRIAELAEKSKKQEFRGFERRNFILHQHLIRKDFSACKALVKEMADEYCELCEYPFYIRGKIARIEGNLREALMWFERARSVNPQNSTYLWEIGRINFLFGNHAKAADIFLDASKLDPCNWVTLFSVIESKYRISAKEFSYKGHACMIFVKA
uniref:TPR_REGION domain-containing protein n=1 Tax=Gongylonema pulchrum TaxID=637853 RepID=A0A183D9Z9_9BILA